MRTKIVDHSPPISQIVSRNPIRALFADRRNQNPRLKSINHQKFLVLFFSWIREPFSSTRTISSPRVFRCVKWYQSMELPSSITQDNGAHTIPIDVDRRVEAIWDAIEEHQLEVHEVRNEICNLLAGLGLIVNQRQPIVDSNCAGGFTRGQPVSLHYFAQISNFNGSSKFQKEDFLDWLLDLENFFEFMKIPHEKKVIFASYKLDKIALKWWNGLQDYRVYKGKDKIHSWLTMKKFLASKFYFHDHEDILSYTNQDTFIELVKICNEIVVVKEKNLHPNIICGEIVCKTNEEDTKSCSSVDNASEHVNLNIGEKVLQTNHKNIEEEEDLIEPSNKEKIEEEIMQPLHGTKKLVDATLDIPRLIVEGSIEFGMVQHQESIQVLHEINLVDFLGVEQSNLIFNTCLIDLVNQLKSAYNVWKRDKQLKYSKYLFIWHGRWQISNMNSRASSFKEEETDVGQDLKTFCIFCFNIFDKLFY